MKRNKGREEGKGVGKRNEKGWRRQDDETEVHEGKKQRGKIEGEQEGR